jgi:hypothetical protein
MFNYDNRMIYCNFMVFNKLNINKLNIKSKAATSI